MTWEKLNSKGIRVTRDKEGHVSIYATIRPGRYKKVGIDNISDITIIDNAVIVDGSNGVKEYHRGSFPVLTNVIENYLNRVSV